MTSEKKRNLAAPCGLYCGACLIYLASKRGDAELLRQIVKGIVERLGQEGKGMPPLRKGTVVSELRKQRLEAKDLACEGCLSETVALHCRLCGFRACAFEKGLLHCAQCVVFPCRELVDFNNDGLPHHGEVLTNIRRQQDIGIDVWIAEQAERWRCPHCGCAIDWYARQCSGCGGVLNGCFDWPESLG